MTPFYSTGDNELICKIEEKILSNLNLDFNPQVFSVLDDEKADEQKLKLAQGYLSQQILGRLQEVGNSFHFARSASGDISSLPAIINRLGVKLTKMLISSVALSSLMKDEKTKKLFARSLSVSIISKLLAQEYGFGSEDTNKAELAGLFFEIGKLPLILYEQKEGDLDKNFFDAHWPYFSSKVIKQFKLPDFISKPIEDFCLTFDERDFNLNSIVFMAWSTIEMTFSLFGKLRIKSPLPDKEDIVTYTHGSEIESLFKVFGVSDYLEIEQVLTEIQQLRLEKKSRKNQE